MMALALCSCQTANQNINQNPSPSTTSEAVHKTVQGTKAQEVSFDELVARCAAWKRQGKSIRQALINMPHIIEVYAIDDYHSLIVLEYGKASWSVTNEAYKDLLAVAQAYGGVVVDYGFVKDPLTGKGSTVITPLKISESPNHVMVYDDPSTGDHGVFGLLYHNFNWQRGDLYVTEIFRDQMVSAFDDTTLITHIKALMLAHNNAQPFLYKTPYLPSPDRIKKIPRDGRIIDNEPIFASTHDTFGKKLTLFLKHFVTREHTYSYRDILQYLTALCKNNGGKCRWVVNKYDSDDRSTHNKTPEKELHRNYKGTLTEVTPVEAWEYSIGNPPALVKPRWFMCCEGPVNFAVRAEKFISNRKTGAWHFRHFLYANRDLQGIDFKPILSQNQKIAKMVREEAGQNPPQVNTDSTAEKMALETATIQTPITRSVGATRYESSFNGFDKKGCALVSVSRTADTTPPPDRRWTDIYNYRVCAGQLFNLGITPPQAISDTLISQLPQVAKICQRYGQNKASTSNYDLYCRALRGQSQCNVEISVLKNQQLVRKFIYDGCTGKRLR